MTAPHTFPDPMAACDKADALGPDHYVTGGAPRALPGWIVTNERGDVLHADGTFKRVPMTT